MVMQVVEEVVYCQCQVVFEDVWMFVYQVVDLEVQVDFGDLLWYFFVQ